MAAAAASALVSSTGPVAQKAAKAASNISEDVAKSFLGPLTNLMNEKYERRKRELEASIAQDQLKLKEELDRSMATLKNDLDLKLLDSKNKEEQFVLFTKFDQDKEKFLLEFDKALELKKEEWDRQDRELFRKWANEDVDRESKEKLRDQLKHLIYISPEATKPVYAQLLAATYNGSGDLKITGGSDDPYKINDASRTQEYVDEITTSKGMTEEEKLLLKSQDKITAPISVPYVNIKDIIDDKLYRKYVKKNKPYKKHDIY